jgi:ATP-dependent DNA helicase PIF1
MELSKEQKLAFDKYVKGDNIFITGPGGSGKSALIRKIKEHSKKEIQVCALTGCAAVLLNCKAKTLHSWSGIGLGNGTIEQNIKKILGSKFKKQVWKDTDVLIVDEVSMLSLKLFNMLNEIGKAVRKNPRPFGGIQLIFSGDFYQLPPIKSNDDLDTQRFCFESDNWNTIFSRDCQIQLVKIFRQTDETYSSILNQVREGKIKKRSNDILLQYVGREADENLVVEPTKLFPTKNKVEYINNSKMSALDSEEKEYAVNQFFDLEMTAEERRMRIQYTREDIQTELDFLTGNLICDKNVKLKIGSQVMCIINIPSTTNDEMICNGSQGIITRFCPTSNLPIVKYNNGIEMIMGRHIWLSENIPGVGVSQVPLILAWALTIHKSQGATLDTAEIDVGSGIFECGQTYVALSRVKSLNGLYLTSFDANRIKINRKVKEYYESLTLFQEQNQEENKNKEKIVVEVEVEAIPVAIPIAIATLVSTNTTEENSNPFSSYNFQNI